MNQYYPNLLSPIKIRNTVFRNRMFVTPSMPHFMQGPETYPSQALIDMFAKRAKAGAACVTVGCVLPKKRFLETAHAPQFDYSDVRGLNYFCKLTEAVHFYGSKISLTLDPADREGYDCTPGMPLGQPRGAGFPVLDTKEYTKEIIEEMVEEMAQQALVAQQCGFDMIFIHCAYRFFAISRFLSPLTNKRTDEFGGSAENRARFLYMLVKRIRELCSKDLLIEISISGNEPEGGISVEDFAVWSKMFDGLIDIYQIRSGFIDPNHPTTYEPKRTPFVDFAAEIKKVSGNIKVANVGGFFYFEDGEAAVRDGKVDIVAGARAWISNEDYGIKAYEGRPQDLVPCLRCNKCHIASRGCVTNSICSVNPKHGSIADSLKNIPAVPAKLMKTAVIGGGPSGMEAALTAAERGHDVTLFEKSDELGGLLKHAKNAEFKWTLNNFRAYMVRKVEESNIKVVYNTEATPEYLKDKGFDHIIVAAGAIPSAPPIPGLAETGYRFASTVFVNDEKDELDENVVIIGGGEIGVDTGLYLAQNGHKVFVIEMQPELAIDATPVHYRVMVEDYWLAQKDFDFACSASVLEVTPEGVKYKDKDANGKTAKGSVLVAAGLRNQKDLELTYSEFAPYVTVVGDSNQPGSVQTCMRTGYAAGVRF